MGEGNDIRKTMAQAERRAVDAAHSIDVAMDPRAFRTALGCFATGVTLITACEENSDTPVGITVNSFASVSLDPALVLWSAARSSVRHRHFSTAKYFAIHVLCEGQQDLARGFTRNGLDFDGVSYHRNADNVPILDGVLASFECETESLHEGGDHTIIIGRVQRFQSNADLRPLVFFGGRFADLTLATGS